MAIAGLVADGDGYLCNVLFLDVISYIYFRKEQLIA